MVKPNLLIGLQWGDEGKGKLIDVLTAEHDTIVRFQGGGNAGHTVVIGDIKYISHYNPSGVFHKGKFNIFANGAIDNIFDHLDEIEDFKQKGIEITPETLMISTLANVILPDARLLDAAKEAQKGRGVGSTIAGIGPTYMLKKDRTLAIRMEDLLDPDVLKKKIKKRAPFMDHLLAFYLKSEEARGKFMDILVDKKQDKFYDSPNNCGDYSVMLDDLVEAGKKISPFIGDTVEELKKRYKNNERILFEGAQGWELDNDFGTFPFVTSSAASGMAYQHDSGLAVEANKIGVVKAYTTRVGDGPFPTEQDNETGDKLRAEGEEFGATTGRPRRCGWLDFVRVKKAVETNRINEIALTKLDVLSCLDNIQFRYGGTDEKPAYNGFEGWKDNMRGDKYFEVLPERAKLYIRIIEEKLGVPVTMISTGKSRDDIIMRRISKRVYE